MPMNRASAPANGAGRYVYKDMGDCSTVNREQARCHIGFVVSPGVCARHIVGAAAGCDLVFYSQKIAACGSSYRGRRKVS